MSKKKDKRFLTEDEHRLWKAFSKKIEPLKDREEEITEEQDQPVTSTPSIKKSDNKTKTSNSVRKPSPNINNLDQKVKKFSYLNAGQFDDIDHNLAKKLKKGQLKIQAQIDLHGFTRAEAMHAFSNFIHDTYHEQKRSLLVITGKGKLFDPSVIRTSLPSWINQLSIRPFILCFCEAIPKHGGAGAFYILLKKKRDQ